MTTPSIFISYRIADTLTQAGRLHQSLENYFGKGTAFYDKSSLKPGMKWPQELEEKVRGAKVVLVLYGTGKDWLGVDDFGRRRMDKPDDWVRQEVETALNGSMLIIPVLFRSLPLPEKDVLPEPLHPLLTCQKCDIRESHWDNDLRPLLDEIEKVVLRKTSKTPEDLSETFDPLEGLALPDPPAYPPPPTPYKGLTWFTEADARIFFGREEDIAELYKSKLEDPFKRVTLFYGPSGSGKSSLLHAGLLPRLRHHGWQPIYCRRTLDGSTEEIIEKYLADLKQENAPRPLLILDQLEEMYTNPISTNEAEHLPDRIWQVLLESEQVRMLLGFREEYLARIGNLLKKGGVPYLEQHLKTMNEKGLCRAITAIPASDLKKYYCNLSFAEGDSDLPKRIARDLFGQHEQDVAPLLQFILRSMWDEASSTSKAVFSRSLFEKHRRSSMLDLLDEQLADLSIDFSKDVLESGLVLDLLQSLVTPEGTAGAWEEQELLERYRHVDKWILPLCQALKNRYLVNVFVDEQDQRHWRLAHDALAPAVERRYVASTALGQRARALLANIDRNYDVDTLIAQFSTPPISLPDLEIIRNGQKGMQALRDNQQFLIQLCETHYETERKKIEAIGMVNEYCKEAKEFINQLQYESAYYTITKSIAYNVKQHEVSLILQEVAFVLAEVGQQRMALKCLKHLQEIVPHNWLPEVLSQLSTLEGEHFRDKTQSIMKHLNAKFFELLKCRYFPEMVEIQGGDLPIGSGKSKNEVQRIVLDSYQIARTPVTWWQYALYCRATGRDLPRSPAWGRLGNHPAVYISWYDAVLYLNWASERLGNKPVYRVDTQQKDPNNKYTYDELKWTVTLGEGINGLRLPTKSEWEYAARGGLSSHGTIYAGSNNADDVAWHYGNAESKTHPVGEKQPNELGLYDMSGNMWEWCWDWYEEDDYTSSRLNPTGPLSGSYRVYRGGSWYVNVDCCRIAFQNYFSPHFQRNDLGFRPARTI